MNEMKKEKFMYAGFSHYNHYIIYQQYGYWHGDMKENRVYDMPDWMKTEKFRIEFEQLVMLLNDPDIRMEITEQKEATREHFPEHKYHTSWRFYDKNNVFLYDTGSVLTKTKEAGIRYANERYHTSKRLMEGCINALMHYKRTGVSCLPDWNTNESDRYGYKMIHGKVTKNKVPRLSELN